MATKKRFGRKPSPKKGNPARVVKKVKAKAKAPTKAEAVARGKEKTPTNVKPKAKAKPPTKAKAKPKASVKASATKKKQKAGILPNVFKMPLSDTTTTTDAARKGYLIDCESTATSWLSQDTTEKEQQMIANIVSSTEKAKLLGTNITLSREEHELYLARINAAESIHLDFLGLNNSPPAIDASHCFWSSYAQGQRKTRGNTNENITVDDDIDDAMARILTYINPKFKGMSNDDNDKQGMANNNGRKYVVNRKKVYDAFYGFLSDDPLTSVLGGYVKNPNHRPGRDIRPVYVRRLILLTQGVRDRDKYMYVNIAMKCYLPYAPCYS
jgi:hypothetical protein